MLVNGLETDHPEAIQWLIRHRYRKEFGLTADEMDQEPLEEIMMMEHIWRLEAKREKLEAKRMEQEQHGSRQQGT